MHLLYLQLPEVKPGAFDTFIGFLTIIFQLLVCAMGLFVEGEYIARPNPTVA